MFALHYAHDYTRRSAIAPRGSAVPGRLKAPDYGDFFYFAVCVGTSGQTADVSFVT